MKLDLSPTPLAQPADWNTTEATNPAPRLIVLVPAEIDWSAATRRIWELANPAHLQIQLITLCPDLAEEASLRRKLITMASLLQEGGHPVESEVFGGTSWVRAVRSHYEAGDMIVCFAEQRAGILQRPLSEMLESNFPATIYVISGLVLPKSGSNRLAQAFAWLGFICIILGFGILQANVAQLPEGSVQTVFLILSIVPEFWLIWVWGHLFG